MYCAVCGLTLTWASERGFIVQRMRRLLPVSAPMTDEEMSKPVDVERAMVCSEACAKAQSQRWQNEDLAEEICRYTHDLMSKRAIASIIRAHRARWEDS